MINFLWVFLGGGMGSLCRYGIALRMSGLQTDFPHPTFWANLISCFILGILMALSLKSNMPTHLKLLFMTGFCGGFSTFSTFTGEFFSLLQNGNFTVALSYIFTSLIICLISLTLGFYLSNMLIAK